MKPILMPKILEPIFYDPAEEQRMLHVNHPMTHKSNIEVNIPVNFVRITETAKVPTYGTQGAVGFDIYSDETVEVSNAPIRIKTGLKFELPPGFGFFIIPRSGMASKQLYVANAPGLLDADYRGELMVLAWSPRHSGFQVNQGERIAQGFIIPVPRVIFHEVDELSVTERGEGGFGSTGK